MPGNDADAARASTPNDHVLVRLVGDDPQVVPLGRAPATASRSLPRQHASRRVLRRVQVDDAGPRRDRRPPVRSTSSRQPRSRATGQRTTTPRAERTVPAAGGHCGSGMMTSSPGFSSAWKRMNSPWIPPFVTRTSSGNRPGRRSSRRSFSASKLLQTRHAGRLQVVRPVVGNRLRHGGLHRSRARRSSRRPGRAGTAARRCTSCRGCG